ncbi:Response regulator MprA [Bosea sp. 62]|uniref:response regulator transcription factor n=1 Tax=unclassified Bosea (in: a-proteobacteria) TaxID=2653178 RepID=UPI00125BB72C|nr:MULTISPECIES: response regulator transcription factor [unclassified Bosea (in: a-proteobacteria)]CAD5258927.1 Response regulator MprA [Bosea sp. 46]CAD5263342.1 Response regulator MprA [Bosea sp. 21B]CAD5276990.1 Response regulator MprA [Bosea sp. 7B]VVT58960.1 Response regulator MprA [Bosea sp. EC-HK365B]VXB64165.1 Response regulator MprA [Bosea sp. 29B]
MRILLVEDEPAMAQALRDALTRQDMVVDHLPTRAEAEAALREGQGAYDAVLLDRQLPDGDGLALVSTLRAAGDTVPVLVLTARGDLGDRILGLDGGADDYLGKPFAFEELLARLRAILRRPPQLRPDIVRIGRLSFDFTHREARIGGAMLVMPRRELLVLEALARRTGRMVVRGFLMEAVFGLDDDIQSNALDTHVSRLRRKLAEASSGAVIDGIRGVGYLLREAA